MSDFSKLISATDFPRERLLKKFEGTIPAGTLDNPPESLIFNHNLGFRPIVFGYYSRTPDFAQKIPFGEQIVLSSAHQDVYRVNSYSNPTQIKIVNSGGNLNALYIRAFAIMPEDLNNLADFSAPNAAEVLQDSTDENYAKLVKYGTLSLAPGQSATIPHNFGAAPYVQLWQETTFYPDTAVWLGDAIGTDQIDLGANNANNFAIFAESYADRVIFRSGNYVFDNPANLVYRIWGD